VVDEEDRVANDAGKAWGTLMLQSMTGYSRVTKAIAPGAVTVELRSTNHRYLEIEQRLPQGFVGLEGQVAELIRGRLKRGRIEATVNVQVPKVSTRRVVVDDALAQAYHERLLELKGRFGLKGGVTLEQLLALPHVVGVVDDQAQRQLLWPAIRQTVQDAVQQLLAMRRAEGRRLLKDIGSQAALIRSRMTQIRARLPQSMTEQKRRLEARVKSLLGGAKAPASARIQEALAILKDTDIHEELVRLESHLSHVREALGGSDSVGKKLDFIAQELVREANTIGAKANDAVIARCVVEIKGAIEKLREQAQNLE